MLKCEYCGRFVDWRNMASFTGYSPSYAVDPPDDEYACLPCWDKSDNYSYHRTNGYVYRNGKARHEKQGARRSFDWWRRLKFITQEPRSKMRIRFVIRGTWRIRRWIKLKLDRSKVPF